MKITTYWRRVFTYWVQGAKFYGKGGKAPAPINPNKIAKSQIRANKATSAFEAKQNRYTQNNPLGTVAWQNNGTAMNPNWVQNTTLTQPQQTIFDRQQQGQANNSLGAIEAGNRARDALSRPMYSADGALAGVQSQLSQLPKADLATRQHVERGLMDRLNPSLQRDENALRTQLANQGLQYGTEAYGNAMRDYSQRVNDARLAVVGQGGQEMERSQNMNLLRLAQMAGTATDRQASGFAGRNQSLGELGAMLQAQGNVSLPTYGGSTTVNAGQAPDMAGLANQQYQAQLSNYNANRASKNGLMGGLGTLAGAGIGLATGGIPGATFGAGLGGMFSDENLKENIVPIGKYPNGLTKYEFNFKGIPKKLTGVIAQEAKAAFPHVVNEDGNGNLMVNYDRLGIEMESV